MDVALQVQHDKDGYYLSLSPTDGGYIERRVVHIKKTEHGYHGFIPTMPGVIGDGETPDATMAALNEGVAAYLAARQ